MATIKRFEDLECWQEARRFVRLIYKLIKNDQFKRDFELVGQAKGSSISCMANIAEGFHRNSTKDFMKFLDYSRASIAETVNHCYVALDQKYINEEEITKVKQQADIVWKKVNNFIHYLSKLHAPNRSRKKINSTNLTNKTN
ncbi:MAG: four helix bundle protein [Deltaproteobacteria bacterium]|nr:four helix bundle protein [Deltaproteobacteria bacterium]